MAENNYQRVKRSIFISMLIVPAIPFFLVVFLGYSYFTSSRQTSTIDHMTRIVTDHRHMIESFLSERKSDLQFLADSYNIRELASSGDLKQAFTHLQRKSEAFTDIGVFNDEGLHLAYYGPYQLAGKDYAKTDWFNEVKKNNFYISDVFTGFRNSPHFIVAVVKKEEGRNWIIRATIDTSLFSDVVEKIRIGGTGEAYLVNPGGLFQTNRRSGGSLLEKVDDADGGFDRFPGVRTYVRQNENGKVFLYASTWLDNKDWLLVVRQEKAEAFKGLQFLSYSVIAISILGGLAILTAAFQATKHIVGQLKEVDAEKKELNRQLVVAGRLAEIGEMSAGFAHEINNPLQITKSELALIDVILSDMKDRRELPENDDLAQIYDSLSQIKSQVDRCGSITGGLLKFARQSEPQTGSVDLNTFLPRVISLVDKKARVEGIAIEIDMNGSIPPVQADAGHLEQVLVNLFNNAIHAVESAHRNGNGSIVVKAESESEGAVRIDVRDNGCGIPSENLDKLFTPFFTTKPVGQGTGLGLSICFGIITEMGGTMEVASRFGEGSTFSIYLKKA